jgi:hypothetical protein
MRKQFKKTFEEIYGIDRANEIKEKAKKTRIEKGCVGIASTKEKEDERRQKISKALKKSSNGGGVRKGSGRGKSGWYKGYWCDSSYELAWVIYHIDFNIDFERNSEGFEYFYNKEKHKFYPDFIKKEIYYELKGYKTKEVEAKINQFPHKIVVLYEKDLKEIFNYVIKRYGKNFISLYENKKYVKTCKACGCNIGGKNKSGLCKKCFNKSQMVTDEVNKKSFCCVVCGRFILKNKTGLCKKCYKQKNKFEIGKSELEALIEQNSYEMIGKMFNVSGSTVKKKVKKFDIEIKREIGYWAKVSGKLIQEEKEKTIKYCHDCSKKLSYKNKSGYCQKCIGKYNCKRKNVNGG